MLATGASRAGGGTVRPLRRRPSGRRSLANSRKAAAPAPADRLGAAVAEALLDDFARHGGDAIERLREDDPKTYVSLMCKLAPARPRANAGVAVVRTTIDLAGPRD